MLFLLATSIYQEIDIMETQLNWKNMLQVSQNNHLQFHTCLRPSYDYA